MNLRTVLVFSFALFLSSCSLVRIKDGEWCGDIGPEGASCFHTLSDKKRDIPKDTWDLLAIGPDHRFGKICTDQENFGEWSKAIQKLCRLTKACSYDFKKKVITFIDKTNSIKSETEKIYVGIQEDEDEEGEESIARVSDSEVSECQRPGEENPSGPY